ncbi:MAG: type II toxin-antitoxin system VapC family toxin [Chitinivibrionia bacterium]|nr:type II toxin-antitoxin system VapC family toxin [Chitinivibrionia bacterium]
MNKKVKIYLDTSIISYLDQQDTPERMAETHKLWEKIKNGTFDIITSSVMIRELNNCDNNKKTKLLNYLSEIDYSEVSINDEIEKIANRIIDCGILTQKSFDDCLHIASAIFAECDLIVSWNFKHIVNIKTIEGVKYISSLSGRRAISIYDPLTFMGGDEND